MENNVGFNPTQLMKKVRKMKRGPTTKKIDDGQELLQERSKQVCMQCFMVVMMMMVMVMMVVVVMVMMMMMVMVVMAVMALAVDGC